MKEKRLIDLYRRDFLTDNFFARSKANSVQFTCPFRDQCMVDPKDEAITTALFGDPDTNVMIIAEAPSKNGGAGPTISGKITKENERDFFNIALLNFVQKYYKSVPYFTDVMKCGVGKQTREKKRRVFKTRIDNCSKRYLVEEINIIQPATILCLGNTAHDTVKKLMKDELIDPTIQIVRLVHYSNQANLPLNQLDKQEIIWPFQAGFKKYTDCELSFFLNEEGDGSA